MNSDSQYNSSEINEEDDSFSDDLKSPFQSLQQQLT